MSSNQIVQHFFLQSLWTATWAFQMLYQQLLYQEQPQTPCRNLLKLPKTPAASSTFTSLMRNCCFPYFTDHDKALHHCAAIRGAKPVPQKRKNCHDPLPQTDVTVEPMLQQADDPNSYGTSCHNPYATLVLLAKTTAEASLQTESPTRKIRVLFYRGRQTRKHFVLRHWHQQSTVRQEQ